MTAKVLDLELLKSNYNRDDFFKSICEDNDLDDDECEDVTNYPTSVAGKTFKEIYDIFIKSRYVTAFNNYRYVLIGRSLEYDDNYICRYITEMCVVASVDI